MFKKVLIADDIDSINRAVILVLEELGVLQIDHVKYCDDALLRIKKAISDDNPYDLLITDLSFETDHRTVALKSGEELVEKIRELHIGLKIIVYSIEDKKYRIKSLFDKYNISAFIFKGRKSIDEMKIAIHTIFGTKNTYITPEMAHLLLDKTINEIDDFDIQIIKQLSLGIQQEEMETKFKALGISPSSKSTIEKRIAKLKDYFKANNTVHLIAIAKDLGIA